MGPKTVAHLAHVKGHPCFHKKGFYVLARRIPYEVQLLSQLLALKVNHMFESYQPLFGEVT